MNNVGGGIASDEGFASVLSKHGFVYIIDEQLLILQSPALIERLFAHGQFQ
jgi:hypothetical protein